MRWQLNCLFVYLFVLDSIKTMEHCDEDTVLVLGDETSTTTSSTTVRSMMLIHIVHRVQ